jgi:hypothetical protein
MNEPARTHDSHGPRSLIHNWISTVGAILAASSFFAALTLIAIDAARGFANPYLGILTYLVAPAFLVGGLALIVAGLLVERRRRRRLAPAEVPKHLRIDFGNPRHRMAFAIWTVVVFAFLLVTAVGSYRTYNFTESVTFCGRTCHTVMKPEYTAYGLSPHARVACVECHIGPGADWFVKSKLSGTYQVYATLFNKYPKPIPAPVKNLRPAQQTCEQCHWPRAFYGNAERIERHYLEDEANTAWTIRLLLKIGGGDPVRGRVGGIHWHMNIADKVEYIATDSARQVIPWVRITDQAGNTTIYQSGDSPLTPAQVDSARPRVMDCIDCHNRPSHDYLAPTTAVNLSLSTGRMSASLPSIKQLAVTALSARYPSTEVALRAIADSLRGAYRDVADSAAVDQAITELQQVYRENIFPEMGVSWRAYPDNIGHMIFPGCFRCHDGEHRSADGRVVSHACDVCHVIIGEGSGAESETISPQGLEFRHPVDIGGAWTEMACTECHSGGG